MSGTTDDFPPVGSLNELPLELRELLMTILVLIYNNFAFMSVDLERYQITSRRLSSTMYSETDRAQNMKPVH
jgi:hypothetical protein